MMSYRASRQPERVIKLGIALTRSDHYGVAVSTRERADTFVQYVGLELKGRIISRGFTAQRVAETMGRSPAAFNRWLNGRSDIPLAVLCEACEIIGVEPRSIVEYAYDRMVGELGEVDGSRYDDGAPLASVHRLGPVTDDEIDAMITRNPAASDPEDGYDPDAEVEAQQDEP
jgi:transcriptional regulator with XRE-family HTH domain